MHTKNIKQKYLTKLTRLTRYHDKNRRERFFPFLLMLQKDTENPRYTEALAVVHYFLDNAIPVTQEDVEFYNVLAEAMSWEKQPDYFKFAHKTPCPLADYLKVIYDLRSTTKASSQAPSGSAIKRRVIVQLQDIMTQQNLTKTALAKKMKTSRSSLNRLLDPAQSVSLQTLQKAADAMGKDLDIHFI